MANSLPGLEPLADQLGAGAGPAADLEHVVVRLDVHEVDRPPDPGRDRLHRHGPTLPDPSARAVTSARRAPVGWAVSGGTRVGVLGAQGKVGTEVCRAVDGADDLELVAALDVDDQLDALVEAEAQAVVDFTHPDVVMDNLEFCIDHGIHAVVGTTGFDADRLATVAGWLAEAPEVGVLVAPNFSIGAVLMMRFAGGGRAVLRVGRGGRAAPPRQGRRAVRHRAAYGRADRGRAPRGRDAARCPTRRRPAWTAPAAPTWTASACTGCGSAAWSPTRRWCSAGSGETLTIRHDSLDRASFTPGVLTGLRAIGDRPGLTVGLEHLLGLD